MLPFGGDARLANNAQEAFHFQLNFQTMHPNRSSTTEGLRTNTSLFLPLRQFGSAASPGSSANAIVG